MLIYEMRCFSHLYKIIITIILKINVIIIFSNFLYHAIRKLIFDGKDTRGSMSVRSTLNNGQACIVAVSLKLSVQPVSS
ncbi:hypothetical protein AML29_14200 [Escherichia coli]|nr:hypothetical protein AML29_14200 [Escherichia coli]